MRICKNSDTISGATFAYDVLGRRIDKVDAMAGSATRYTYDSHPLRNLNII